MFKPKKSRTILIKKGRLTEQFHLFIQGNVIPLVRDDPIICLRKLFDDSLKDERNVSNIKTPRKDRLNKITSQGLRGSTKHRYTSITFYPDSFDCC